MMLNSKHYNLPYCTNRYFLRLELSMICLSSVLIRGYLHAGTQFKVEIYEDCGFCVLT